MPDLHLHWYAIPDVSLARLDRGEVVEWEVANRRICLVRHQETIFAFQGRCPHASGRLAEGQLNTRGEIVCPVHGYRFRVDNGFNSSGEGFRLMTYPVRTGLTGWEVGVPEGIPPI